MLYLFRGLLGIGALLALAVLFSSNRRHIPWRTVAWGLVLNFLFAFLVLRTTAGRKVFGLLAGGIQKIIDLAGEGTAFVFGPLFNGFDGLPGFTGWPYAFFFTALVPIIFFAALINLLYHFGIMQRIVHWMAHLFTRLLGLSSVEATVTAANVFLGQTQAPLVVAPYLKRMTSSELFLTMTGGMATVGSGILVAYAGMGARMEYVLAASIMAAPAAVVFSKILLPETEETAGRELSLKEESVGISALDAFARGALEGGKVVLGVAVMLLAFIPLIHLLDWGLETVSLHRFGLEELLGWLFAPAGWMIGVPAEDVTAFARLLGIKTAFNEVVAFSGIQDVSLSPRGFMLACFALTGFSNLSSIAIQIGGLGEIAPDRRGDVARLGARAVFAATLANLFSAAIAGLFFVPL